MAQKTDFTPEEWAHLTGGPVAAALYVITASPSLLGMFSEVNAMLHAIQAAASGAPAGTLLAAVLADLNQTCTKQHVSDLRPGGGADQASAMAQLLEAVRLASSAVGAKGSLEEAQAYGGFVLGVARAVAQAAKDDGQAVSAKEKAALDTLAQTLGVSA
jgi:hypothetical protein